MSIYLFAVLVVVTVMSSLFVLALALHDNSIVDIAYGAVYLVLGWSVYLAYGTAHPRSLLLLALISLWGARLTVHLFLRKGVRHGEDFRYRKWREEWGENFVWRSFLQVFMLQGAVILMVALPLLLVIHRPGGALGALDLLGVLLWLCGFLFEAIADWQLLHFKRAPQNRGRLIQSGLWRYSRHPNYFGEALLWWGPCLIAFGAPLGVIGLLSPLVIGFLLLRVSGIPMLEAKYEGEPEFEDYKLRTSAFFPWFPGPAGKDC